MVSVGLLRIDSAERSRLFVVNLVFFLAVFFTLQCLEPEEVKTDTAENTHSREGGELLPRVEDETHRRKQNRPLERNGKT